MNLEKIVGERRQVVILYQLLSQRSHVISHLILPSFEEHAEFVRKHPYRVWYLIKLQSDYIGTAYLTKNNCIGINFASNIDRFGELIHKLMTKHRPLKEVKSLRPPYFYVNVATGDTELERQLALASARKIQSTFALTQSPRGMESH